MSWSMILHKSTSASFSAILYIVPRSELSTLIVPSEAVETCLDRGRDRWECISIASTSSFSGSLVEGRYWGNGDRERNDWDKAHKLVKMAETSSRLTGRTSRTVAFRGTLNRNTRISSSISMSLSDASTTSEYNFIGRGKSETSFFWISISDRLMDIEVYYKREDMWDHSLELVVPIYCRLRRSLDTL